jgi:uncharacterized integral membrane protein (TIGR00698 family)
MTSRISAQPQAADLYGDLEPPPAVRLRDYLPGLTVTALAALAAAYLSDHYGAPLTLMALLIGLALNFLSADARLTPGLAFASRTLLRLGIVLVGVRITLDQVADLGPWALLAILVVSGVTVCAGIVAGRAFGFGSAFGTLAGGAVAICGASAALALATVLGEKRANQAQLTLVLVIISALSSLAMFLYPIIAHQLALSDTAAGFMIGASVHDVAQALGAGYAFSPAAGETAAIVKLTRVALLAPLLALVAFGFPAPGAKRASFLRLPWFVVGFFVLAAINSAIDIPPPITDATGTAATALLAAAVAATGMRSPMNSLMTAGLKPMLVIIVPTIVALVLATAAAILLMPQIG